MENQPGRQDRIELGTEEGEGLYMDQVVRLHVDRVRKRSRLLDPCPPAARQKFPIKNDKRRTILISIKHGVVTMNFLKAVEGLRGETLTSAAWKYAILQSPKFRSAFVEWLVQILPPGEAPNFDSGLTCTTELSLASDHDIGGSGFVDIVLESQSHLIFIENKLGAGFQRRQLRRYFNSLQSRSNTKDCQRRGILIVLYPSLRTAEVEKQVAEDSLSNDEVLLLTWDKEVVSWLDEAAKTESMETAAACKFLAGYVKSSILDDRAEIKAAYLEGRSCPTQPQKEFLFRIYNLFKYALSYRTATAHTGFSFKLSHENKTIYGWLGFALDQKTKQARLIMQIPESFAGRIDAVNTPDQGRREVTKRGRVDYAFSLSGHRELHHWLRSVEPILNVINNGYSESVENQTDTTDAA